MMIRQPSNNLALVVLAVGTFVLGLDGFLLSGLLPELAADLDVSLSAAGQLTTLFAVSYAAGSPVIAAVTGFLDRRVVLRMGLVVFVVGLVLQALGPTYIVVAAGRILAALGAAAFQATAYAVAGLLADDATRGRALAVVAGGTAVSAVIGVPFGVLVGQEIGWRGATWIVAVLATAAGLLTAVVPSVHAPSASLRARIGVLVRPQVLVVLVGMVLITTPTYLVGSYLPVVLGVEAERTLVVALVAIGLGTLVGNRLVGRLIDTHGGRWVATRAMVAVAGCNAVLALVADLRVAAIATLLVGSGFGIGAVTAQQQRAFGAAPDAATVALGLAGSAIYAGFSLGSSLGGLVLVIGGATGLPIAAAAVGLVAATWLRSTGRDVRRPEQARVGSA